MKVLKIAANQWTNDSRDKRELSVYRSLGADVIVMAKAKEGKMGHEIEDSFDVYRYSTRPLGERVPRKINQVCSLIVWAHIAREFNPDVISGHDITGTVIGWMSSWFRIKKPKLIYDSHEFELGRNKKRNKLQMLAIKQLEKIALQRSTFSIMVNDSIAEEVMNIYKLDQKPIVVKNTPNYWIIDSKSALEVRNSFINKLLTPNSKGTKKTECSSSQDCFIIMYHGLITTRRGCEELINLVSINPNIVAIILGNGENDYVNSLKEMAIRLKVDNRVLFHPAVPFDELWKYVGAADLSLVVSPKTPQSYYFGLPNKFFESIQSETPLLVSDVPEMKRVIEKYQIGLICEPTDIQDINSCVEKMRTDREFYNKCKENLKVAKRELCWETEKKALEFAAKKYLNINERD